MSNLLLIVTIAGERVAISATSVDSVVQVEDLVPVPRAPAHLAGLAALRSRVLTAIDCRAALGLGETEIRPLHDAIVVEEDGHPYALLVDGVEDVIEHDGELQPLRGARSEGWARAATGMLELDGRLALCLKPAALIAGPFLANPGRTA
jgi:purine-binding chemotaxis protein CheW